jgi:2-dehydropantoate 2-reductase
MPDVMQSKYSKLLFNLRNILEATLGLDTDYKQIDAVIRSEAEAVYRAAGITWRDIGISDPRRAQLMRYQPIEGVDRSGSSTTQSLARGTGSIETDYLNGEIVLLGRLHGVPVPANAYFVELSARMVREKLQPGSISVAQVEAALKVAGVEI